MDYAVSEMKRFGYDWTEVADYVLARISRRVQVRDAGHYDDKATIKRYAEQMKHGTFPPIIVTQDHVVVDGNHRISARELKGDPTCTAYVLAVNYEKCLPRDRSKLALFAASLNAANGKTLTAEEATRAARDGVILGWTNKAISGVTGITDSVVKRVRRIMASEARLAAVGSTVALSQTAVYALGDQRLLALNDGPFRELARLIADADLRGDEVRDLGRRVRSAGSDAASLDLIAGHRQQNAARISERALAGVARPPASAKLRKTLDFVLGFRGREVELVESSAAAACAHVDCVHAAIEILQRVLVAQSEARAA